MEHFFTVLLVLCSILITRFGVHAIYRLNQRRVANRSGNERRSKGYIDRRDDRIAHFPPGVIFQAFADTANLREGANLHDGSRPPAKWSAFGAAKAWDAASRRRGDDLRYAEQIIVSHDGQNHLNWQTRSWVDRQPRRVPSPPVPRRRPGTGASARTTRSSCSSPTPRDMSSCSRQTARPDRVGGRHGRPRQHRHRHETPTAPSASTASPRTVPSPTSKNGSSTGFGAAPLGKLDRYAG